MVGHTLGKEEGSKEKRVVGIENKDDKISVISKRGSVYMNFDVLLMVSAQISVKMKYF